MVHAPSLLLSHPLISPFKDADWVLNFMGLFEDLQIAEKSEIFAQGLSQDRLYLIVQGEAKLLVSLEEQVFPVLRKDLKAGDSAGILGFLGLGVESSRFQSRTELELVFLSRENFEKFKESFPMAAAAWLMHLCASIVLEQETLFSENAVLKSMLGRLKGHYQNQ